MTTPTPDKLAIPEAAVEAAARAMAKVIGNRHGHAEDNWLSEARYEEARAALAAALPHMPDRGYAEGIEAAAKWHDDQQQEERGPDYGMASEIDRATWRTYNRMHANSAATIRALAPPAPADNGELSFQGRVAPWMQACFGPEISGDRLERGDRFLEEALELLQSGDYPRERVAALTDYVYSRSKGEPHQKVGGVMVTLAAYCLAHDLNMHQAAEDELARIWTKVDKIRAKQATKPVGSALPVATPRPHQGFLTMTIKLTDEAEKLLKSFSAAYRVSAQHAIAGGKAFCPTCRWAGMTNCGYFDECEAFIEPDGHGGGRAAKEAP